MPTVISKIKARKRAKKVVSRIKLNEPKAINNTPITKQID